jgi:formylglycine-generating enzyme required for sulfatase activity
MERDFRNRANWTFGELLAWHLLRGTRPGGKIDRPGREWSKTEFAQATGLVDRTIRYWLSDEHLPPETETIERLLFGHDDAYAEWRLELRLAYARSRGTKSDTLAPLPVDTNAALEVGNPKRFALAPDEASLHAPAEPLKRPGNAPAASVAVCWHRPPFRGLLSFEYHHAPVFFGRTRARNELRELLARREATGRAFVLVLGASGSGKSSLVKAGLLPDLQLPSISGEVGLVRWALLRPSEARGDLLDVLAATILSASALPELAAQQYTPQQLGALLREAPTQAALPIRQGLAAAGAAFGFPQAIEGRLVLVVDQLEELFTSEGMGQSAREAFVAALDALAGCGLVWVIATMRSDFLDQLETLRVLGRLCAREARFTLLPPNDAEFGQIIRQPALEAGLQFEVDPAHGVGLDEVIRQATVVQQAALPVLSFLLDQLWRWRTENGFLTFEAYRELGELEGIVGRRAEEVFLEQPKAVRQELPVLLRALVTVHGGTPIPRPAPLSLFPVGSPRRVLVEALLDPGARLLEADAGSGGAELRLASAALLSHWPRAREQIAADSRDLELRGRLEQQADTWRNTSPQHQKTRLLAAGLPLAEARGLVARWGADLSGDVRAFVDESRRAIRWRRFRLAAAVAGAIIALPVIASLICAGMVWRGVGTVEAEMPFVSVPAGCFNMGSADLEGGRYPNEGPVHQVCLKSLEVAKFEVTQAQWRRVMWFINPAPSHFSGDDNLPVESVSWNEAQWFARLMSFFGRHQYRLPSEAEWEYAARAGTETARYWGERAEDGCAYENIADLSLKQAAPDIVSAFANCDDASATTKPVGSFKPSPFGLHDMLGNVAEWVADCYVDNYRDAPADGSVVVTSECPSHVVRGGAWNYEPRYVRAAYRDAFAPGRNSGIGFRLARTVSP